MPAPKVDWRKHDRAITDVVRSLSTYYLHTQPNNATPRKMMPLIKWLNEQTTRLAARAKGVQVASAAAGIHVPDWVRDFEKWRERMDGYRSVTERAIEINPDNRNAADFTAKVTMPLLLGWYPDPGQIVQKPPDVVTPMTIAHMADIRQEARDQNWRDLWRELEQRTKTTGLGALAVGAAVAVGALVLGRMNE